MAALVASIVAIKSKVWPSGAALDTSSAPMLPLAPGFDQRIGSFDTHLIPYIIEAGERSAEHRLFFLRLLQPDLWPTSGLRRLHRRW